MRRWLERGAWALAACSLGSAAAAQTTTPLATRSLVATCAGCHGTEGKAVAGETMPVLAGMPKDYLVTTMRAFRDGSRPATVMHQLSKGYSDAQIDAIAAALAAQK